MLDLIEPMENRLYTMGFGINASGEVTGFGDTAIPKGSARFARRRGCPRRSYPAWRMFVFALGINDAGQVVGAADSPGTASSTRLSWMPMAPFTTFGWLNGSSTSGGKAIDNAGRVVGQASVDADGATQHAFKRRAAR